MKKLSVLILVAVSLCIALAGCDSKDPAKDFVGTWEAVEVTMFDYTMDEDSLEIWKQNDSYFYIELNEDGTAELTDDGIALPGTWTFEGEGKASFEAEDLVTAALELKDGQIVATYDYFDDPRTAIYKRIDPSAKIQAPTIEEYLNDESGNHVEYSRIEATIDDLTDATEMSVAAVDDDLCAIKAVGKGSSDGMPCIIFELTNKSDEIITFESRGSWIAGGIENYPNLYAPVRAGETVSVMMIFYPDEVGEDPSVLTDVSGKITLFGPADSKGQSSALTSYDVAF